MVDRRIDPLMRDPDPAVPAWLPSALNYVERWLTFQMRHTEQTGCSVAIAFRGDIVLERAFGVASLATREPLTARHRFRVASHSKTFAATAVMLLRERGQLRLDDRVGQHVDHLRAELAGATVGQLLSHAAGLSVNGADQAHWNDLAAWPDEAALRRDLALPLALDPGAHHRYSNVGYGLVGLLVSAITGEPFGEWVAREVIRATGLRETAVDFPAENTMPLASGHAGRLPMGRFVVPGTNTTGALAAATGFVSAPADLARFFAQLDPANPTGLLSPASRREMIRRHWRAELSSTDAYYGLGVISGTTEGQDWFGHSGSFQGYQSRTCVLPDWGLTISLAINAVDGPANTWMDTIVHILKRFSEAPATSEALESWKGRWWNLWGVVDLVAVGDVVVAVSPDDTTPFTDADEIETSAPNQGRVRRSAGYRNFGEPVELVRDPEGRAIRLNMAGDEFLPEEAFVARQRSPAS